MAGNSLKYTYLPLIVALPEGPHPTEVHQSPCENCPSMCQHLDPEAEDTLKFPYEDLIESLFTCGWRPHKLCRGWYDRVQKEIEERQKLNK